jgi:aryl-alcohol dehydrogenase-like predicted oxidoreductase
VLGRTGIEVSELGLGTWGLSGDAYGPVTEGEMERTIDRAVEIGVTLFDTADVYASGVMERLLGKRLPIGKTTVVTKIGTNLEAGQKQFDAPYLYLAFDRSQERLARSPVDVVLLHNPSMFTMKKDEPFEVLERLKGKGQIKAWGVSAGSIAVAEKAIERGAEIVEMPYNCFFFGDVTAVTDKLREKNVGLLARSVLAHGLLSGHWSGEREFYPPDHRADRWNPDDLKKRVEQLAALRSCVGGAVPTMRALAIRFVLENADVGAAILGPRSKAQLDQLVREAGRMPPYLAPRTMTKLMEELRVLNTPAAGSGST